MLEKLQEEHREWSIKNFGEQDIEVFQLGLIEEVGELAHSVLKRKQGTRNTEGHDLLIRDAIGDITIYLVGFCNCEGIDIQEAYGYRYTIALSGVVEISANINNLLNHKDLFSVIHLLCCLSCFCQYEGIDYEQTVRETWENVVSKRDWKADPDCNKSKNIIVDSGIEKLLENSDKIISIKQ